MAEMYLETHPNFGPDQIRAHQQRKRMWSEFSCEEARPRFPLVPFADIKLSTARDYLVKGFIPRGLTVVWGKPKCGKSFFVFDVCMHIALGWQYRERKTIQGPVVYGQFEGAAGFTKRKEAFLLHHMPQDYPGPVPFYLLPMRVDLIEDHPDLIASIRAQVGSNIPAVVVLDTLNRSLSGSESKDEDMAAYIKAADSIREELGCSVIIVHHCGVNETRPRGHTSLSGALDCQLAVEKGEDGIFSTTVELMKDDAEGNVITNRLERVIVGIDDDGDEMTSCIVQAVDGLQPKPKQDRKMTDRQTNAMKALTRAVLDFGKPAPATFGLPASVFTVQLDQWREELKRSGTIERDAKNPREDFRRLKTELKARNLIAIRDEHVWPL